MADTTKKAAPADRPGWDKNEWDAKAKAKDQQFAEQAKNRDAALAQGRKPRYAVPDDGLPKPTEALKMRTEDLEIEKNLNKTMIVQTSTTGTGQRGAGFYCDLCDRTLKDSLSYLDHVNGRFHLRKLGQTTQVTRSTLSQVRAKIASLRAATAAKVTAQNFDFQSRINAIKSAEMDDREARKADRKRKREQRREEDELRRLGIDPIIQSGGPAPGKGETAAGLGAGRLGGGGSGRAAREAKKADEKLQRDREEQERLKKIKEDELRGMEDMMGFGGFSGKKRK